MSDMKRVAGVPSPEPIVAGSEQAAEKTRATLFGMMPKWLQETLKRNAETRPSLREAIKSVRADAARDRTIESLIK